MSDNVQLGLLLLSIGAAGLTYYLVWERRSFRRTEAQIKANIAKAVAQTTARAPRSTIVPNMDDASLDDLREYTRVFGVLHEYGKRRERAYNLRLEGDIQEAVKTEAQLDELYQLLPPEHRW